MGDITGTVASLVEAVRALLNRGNDQEVADLKAALEEQKQATQAVQDAYAQLVQAEDAEDVTQNAALDEAKADLDEANRKTDEAVEALEALLAEINDALDDAPTNGEHPDNTLPNELPGAGEGEPDVINPLKR